MEGEDGLGIIPPQPAVNNFADAKEFPVNNSIFTARLSVNTPGPEDESRFLNVRRFTEDFRSGPGALMQRNSQSLSPTSQLVETNLL
jgi:hypothetical protein